MPKKPVYDNESIQSLKGADRVRLRPAVIFGSDGIDGCQHSVFEILSNSIDEARQGYGDEITLTRFLDKSVQVEDHGRGCPVDFNQGRTMSILWGSTAWGFALPSTPRSIWMWRCAGTDTATVCILSMGRMWGALGRRPTGKRTRAR